VFFSGRISGRNNRITLELIYIITCNYNYVILHVKVHASYCVCLSQGANDCGLCMNFNTTGGVSNTNHQVWCLVFFQTFSVPAVANCDAKAFEFQTNKIEKGSIECLHQHRQVSERVALFCHIGLVVDSRQSAS